MSFVPRRNEYDDVSTAIFYGLGANGTVGANKNSIKITSATKNDPRNHTKQQEQFLRVV